MDQFSYVVIGVGIVLFAAAGISFSMFRSFNSFIVFLWLAIADLIWGLFMGAPGNFKDAFGRHEPLNTLGKAQGNGDLREFVKTVSTNLESGNVNNAIEACAKQQGSLSNILRSSLERYVQLENNSEYDAEKKLSEVQRAIDEATNLETPLLEKNLVILSTVASVSTMVGLLGTTLGMIRSFAALGASGGAVSAQALSIGISEALYNTAFGLAAAIVSILSFNFFTTKVDNFVYMIDEAILSVMEILTIKVKK